MNDLIPLKDIERMASIMGEGKLFGKTAKELFPLMLIAQAEGRHPAIVAMEYDIIQGKPAINSRAALARFQSSGGKIEWKERTDTKAEAVFSHPSSSPVSIIWDMARANMAGLENKSTWKQYPRQMLSARVIAEGVRACYPACLLGFYTVEEMQDTDTRALKNVSPDIAETPPATETPKPAEPKPEAPAAEAEKPKIDFVDDIPWADVSATKEDITALREELRLLFEDKRLADAATFRGLEWLKTEEANVPAKLHERIAGMQKYFTDKEIEAAKKAEKETGK